MQVFLFGALGVALVAVLFALQNIVPVRVAFLTWTFEGSLAVLLFVAFIAGALTSFLASVPTLFRGRRTARQQQKRIHELQTEADEYRRKLSEPPPRVPRPPSGIGAMPPVP